MRKHQRVSVRSLRLPLGMLLPGVLLAAAKHGTAFAYPSWIVSNNCPNISCGGSAQYSGDSCQVVWCQDDSNCTNQSHPMTEWTYTYRVGTENNQSCFGSVIAQALTSSRCNCDPTVQT
jgi:hypothetical protein